MWQELYHYELGLPVCQAVVKLNEMKCRYTIHSGNMEYDLVAEECSRNFSANF